MGIKVRVGQFANKNRLNRLFVCSFSRVSGSGESWLSAESDSAPPSFSFSNESRSCNGANGQH